jgi:hypothetical protein
MFSFNPYDPAIDADPFPAYRVLRDEFPCYWCADAQVWVLTRYADVLAAGNDWATYSSMQGNLITELPARSGATLGTTDPPRHDRLRALVQHAFVRRNLQGLAGEMRRIAREIADTLRGRERFDFNRDFSTRFTVRTLNLVLGLPPCDEDLIRAKAMLMLQTDPATRGKTPEHLEAFQWISVYAAEVIAERRAHPGEDLISQFSVAEIDGDRLDEREVVLTTTMLIVAGVESMGAFMSLFAMNLADHPEARQRCVAEPARLADALEESLRYNTSAQRFKRTLTRDIELYGQTLNAGDAVALVYGAANRDERRFPDPDRYDIDRKPRGHLGFGGGVHACLGSAIVRQSISIAFEELHRAVPAYRRAEAVLPWMPSTTFRSPTRLDLIATA